MDLRDDRIQRLYVIPPFFTSFHDIKCVVKGGLEKDT